MATTPSTNAISGGRPSVGGLPSGMGGLNETSYTGNINWNRGTAGSLAAPTPMKAAPTPKPTSKPNDPMITESALRGFNGKPMGFFNPNGTFDSSNQII